MTTPTRSRAVRVLVAQILVSGGLLALLLTRVSIRDVVHQAAGIPAATWALGIAACIVFWVAEAIRLCSLARWVGRPLPLARAMHINLVSNVYAFVLFGWVGGGGYRAWRFTREGWSLEAALVVIAVDRAFTMGGLCIAAAILFGAGAWAPSAAGWTIVAAIAAAPVLSAIGLAGRSRAADLSPPPPDAGRWGRLAHVMRVVASAGPRRIAGALAISVLPCAAGWAWSVVTARDIGIRLPWLEVAWVVGVVAFVQQIPVSWLGTGPREWTYELLFSRRGVTTGMGAALGGVQLCVALAWTGFALLAHLLVPARAPLDPGRGEGP